MSDADRVFLTPAQALSVLKLIKGTRGRSHRVHTFVQSGGSMLLGADWHLPHVKQGFAKAKSIEISGRASRQMGHGIAFITPSDSVVYLATDEEKLAALETELTVKR